MTFPFPITGEEPDDSEEIEVTECGDTVRRFLNVETGEEREEPFVVTADYLAFGRVSHFE